MAGVSNLITLGIGTPAEIDHLILFGLSPVVSTVLLSRSSVDAVWLGAAAVDAVAAGSRSVDAVSVGAVSVESVSLEG